MSSYLLDMLYSDADRVISNVNLSPINGKSVLISGASGLLGTHIVAALARYCSTTGKTIDICLISRHPLDALRKNLADAVGATSLNVDLSAQVPMPERKFDYVIHAAGYAQPQKFMADPTSTLRLNTVGTFSLFECLKANGTFLFISSSEVYSGLGSVKANEEQVGSTNTTHPRSCYIEGKRAGEAICNAYRSKGINAFSARLALAYGPGSQRNDKRVMNSFIERGLRDGIIEMQDRGIALRTYCYISDALEMLFNILLYGRRPIYNVGGCSRVSIGEMAKLIGKKLKIEIIIPDHDASVAGSPSDVQIDLSSVTSDFNKTMWVDFDEGLDRAIAWHKGLSGYEQ